jgi:hypothetical protein
MNTGIKQRNGNEGLTGTTMENGGMENGDNGEWRMENGDNGKLYQEQWNDGSTELWNNLQWADNGKLYQEDNGRWGLWNDGLT